MAAKHKHQNAQVSGSSTLLSATALVQLARDVVAEVGGVAIDEPIDGGLSVVVRNLLKVKILRFVVLASEADGTNEVHSRIVEFRTSQSKLLYFIPIGPKTLLGYKPYKNFMELYAKAILKLDPAAQVRVTELDPQAVR